MTKKDYKILGRLFGEVLAETHTKNQQQFLISIINRLTVRLKDQNQQFDNSQFHNYIKDVWDVKPLINNK